VVRAKGTKDRGYALSVAEQALAVAEQDADLLGAITSSLSAYEDCQQLPTVADRWFLQRGDANAYTQRLAPCMGSADAARRLKKLRSSWGPLGDDSTWTALVKAGHQPFELLYRDLDFVLDQAKEFGAKVVLVNYPNPSEDHTALREILSDYATSRTVHYVDTYGHFVDRFENSPDEWQRHLGPNGHANELGYRLMADDILNSLSEGSPGKNQSIQP
jgi:hypothetical protein